MQITVYVDVLFLVNLIADYGLISITALLLRLSPRIYRLLLSALSGAIYASAVFFIPLSFLPSLWMKLIVSAVMVLIAFGAGNFRKLCKHLAVFYLAALSLGGLCFALFAMTGLGPRLGAVYVSGVLYLNIPARRLILAGGVLYIILRAALRTAEKCAAKAQRLYTVRLTRGEQSAELSALYDTGNFLTDPATGDGAVLAVWDSVKTMFGGAQTPSDAAEQFPGSFTLLTCTGIGGQEILPAFYAETSLAGTKRKKGTKPTRRLVAVTQRCFDHDGRYFLILPNDFEGADLNDGTFVKRRDNDSKISMQVVKKLADRNGRHG